MAKRPSLFAAPPATPNPGAPEPASAPPATVDAGLGISVTTETAKRPPSRSGKRVLSIFLEPLAWKQLRQLALDTDTSTQALGEEAVNLLFAKHGINRSA